jgi:hypothetical protein
MTNWQHREQQPELNDAFNRYIATGARRGREGRARGLRFRPHAHVADIGGGTGLFLGEILAAHGRLRGTLVDQPHVLDAARENLARLGVAGRCAVVPGRPLRSRADGRRRLHPQERPPRLGRRAGRRHRPELRVGDGPRRAPARHRVGLPDDEVGDAGTRLLDIHMLVVDGGRERRLADYARLFEAAGLRLERRLSLGRRAEPARGGPRDVAVRARGAAPHASSAHPAHDGLDPPRQEGHRAEEHDRLQRRAQADVVEQLVHAVEERRDHGPLQRQLERHAAGPGVLGLRPQRMNVERGVVQPIAAADDSSGSAMSAPKTPAASTCTMWLPASAPRSTTPLATAAARYTTSAGSSSASGEERWSVKNHPKIRPAPNHVTAKKGESLR